MSPERAELLARILNFDIDGGPVALPFAARLARENGWSRPHAERVVAEYKRFVFLAVTNGTPVCPSEDVDAAWHLHLTYTRSYWQRFCAEVLGRPLHHDPTKGGPAEGEKHLAMYAATLAAYRAAFGASAPADIWPDAARRFGEDTRHRAVNTARNWVVPKAPVKRAAALVGLSALAALFVPGCEGGLNPFALRNTEFLLVLGLALVAAVCLGRVVRSAVRTPNPLPEDDALELDWEETAYLAGGAGRLTTAAIARLVGRGAAKVGDDGKHLEAAGPAPDGASAVEKAVLGALPVLNTPASLKPVQGAVDAAFAPRAARLHDEGLTLPAASQARVAISSVLPLAVVLLFLAAPRLVMGLAGGHRVGYLLIESLVGGFVAVILILAGSWRLSNRGRALLERQKKRHDTLRVGEQWSGGGDAGMAVALFGTAVLAGTMVAPLQTWYPRQTADASASGCSSGCGSGCATNTGGSSDSGGSSDGGSGCGSGCGGGGD